MSPIRLQEGRTLEQQLKAYILEGYARIFVDNDFVRIDDYLAELPADADPERIYLVIDRMSVDDSKDAIARLVDSSETAFFEGHGELRLMFPPSNICYDFSTRFEADGIGCSPSIPQQALVLSVRGSDVSSVSTRNWSSPIRPSQYTTDVWSAGTGKR